MRNTLNTRIDRPRCPSRRRGCAGWGLSLIGCGLAALIAICLLPAPTYAADGDALVIVNERPISKKQVADKLFEAYGLRMMQQMIVLELAKQETRNRGLTVSDADIQSQYQVALDEIVPKTDATGTSLSEADKTNALLKVLNDKCLTLPEYMIAMERNAHLRKAVEGDVQVTDETLREEFARTRGEKVQIRRITVPLSDRRALNQIVDRLARGDDFGDVARELSADAGTASDGGLMPPFAFSDDEIPAAIRELAFSLKAGERSTPTLVGSMIHLIQIERRIPPSDAQFEQERDKVEHEVRERVIRQRMNELMTRLFQQARIRVLDPQLRREYEQMLKDNTLESSLP